MGVLSQRQMYLNAGNALIDAGEDDKALEMLDLCQENVPEENYPLETIPLGFSGNDYMVCEMVDLYYKLGEPDKARELAIELFNNLLVSSRFYLEFYDYAQSDFELCGQYVYYLQDIVNSAGDKELAGQIGKNFEALMDFVNGGSGSVDEADSLTVGEG